MYRESDPPPVAGYGAVSLETTAIFSNAHDLQFRDSTFTVAGGNVVHNHNHNIHHHYERPKDGIWAILQSIPNFRKIYQDMLSKVTPETGMWLLKGDKFRLWLEPNGDIKIFWGSGIPGAGKTLLAAIVIEHLETLSRESDSKVCVCYVFFRYSTHAEVAVRSILEILVMQTLERHPDCHALVEKTYSQHLRERTEPTESQLLALLQQLNEGMSVTFYVIDALDEAPTKIQLAVVRTLASLNVKLFITSRPLKTVEASFPEAHNLTITAQDNDIDLHIAKGLADNADLQNLIEQSGGLLREEIVSTIKHNCGGMFLHAALQLDALHACFSARDVKDTLKAFPSRIEDVYRQTWARISSQSPRHVSLAKSVLVWVLNASRSMTIEELEHAIATSPETYKFEASRRVPGITLISLCRGLVIVEEESRHVRLVHYTAKDTLEGLLRESFPHPHSLLAAVCMTHLTERGFQHTTISSCQEFEIALENDPLLAYASDAWAFHARAGLDVDETKCRTAQFIGQSHDFPAFTSPGRTSYYFDILTPLHVAGLYHLPPSLISDTVMDDPNVTTRLRQQSPLISASWSGHKDLVAQLLVLSEIQVNWLDAQGWSAIMWAAHVGHVSIVALLLTSPAIKVNLVNHNGWSALIAAARKGHEGVVKLLLAHPEIQFDLVTTDGWSALIWAASEGHEGVVTLLLARPEIQVNLVTNDGWSALILAASEGHEGVVTLLLARPEIQVNLVTNDGWSALLMAASSSEGHEGVVTLLLARPEIQVNLVTTDGWSALIWAASEGHEGVVTLLLARPEIQVNLVTNDGWSALIWAAHKGHEGVVTLLLAHPEIQVNLTNNDGWSALLIAARWGHEGVVTLLLAHPDIQVNLVKNDGCSALMRAAPEGHEGVVKLLLAHPEIQVNLVATGGWSALIWAASQGCESVVTLLLAHPEIQVNLVTNDGWSALIWAAREGHEGVVTLLLAHPEIQVNLIDNDGCSALLLAACWGHEGVVTLLLAHPEIQVNLVTNDGWSALIWAAHKGHEGVVTPLLAHPEIQVNLVTNDGWSALIWAAREGHEGVVKLLLAHPEIQVNLVTNDGWSALLMAARWGHEGVITLLLAHPYIQVSLVTKHGSTALLLAAEEGHTAVVELLLATGVFDVNAYDQDRDTAIKMAAEKGHEDVLRLFLDLPSVDTTIRSTTDGHTAMSAAQANGHSVIVELLRNFESWRVFVATPPTGQYR